MPVIFPGGETKVLDSPVVMAYDLWQLVAIVERAARLLRELVDPFRTFRGGFKVEPQIVGFEPQRRTAGSEHQWVTQLMN